MRFPGRTPPARFFLALCVWRLVPRRDATGTEEVVFGKVGGSILLLCRNVSKEATEVLWFQGDPRSFPPLFSSRVAFPPDVRFSLVDNSSLSITELRAQDEGNYTCKEVLNQTDHEHRVQLLVANPPQSTPKCWAETSASGLMLQLVCSWPGGYPHPTLHWREEGQDLENSSWVLSSTSSSDTHVETLNSSHLSHRQVFKCVGSHVVRQEEPTCTVEIKIPSLESDPPKTCLVGDSVTLTCRVTESTPSARLTWLRGITQPGAEIQPGGRYLIAQEGNVSRLTIQNCSQATDGGCYVCKAQNPVGLRELFICLTVKGEWGLNRDSDDILVLVDSDDDDGNGEEEAMSSSAKQEVLALVNGSSVPASYLKCLMEGDDGEQHGRGSAEEMRGEETQGS
ncbi:V-set and immunoglobulin domain-containing protein 10 isoform X2 [Pezoporus flaviventris]|uniref:V-set and immunoglobulin domain-containing protein 10 isoform X2 n=1 Tax=Pezoporus flaviventris TaxID=889875 RepID=UPI002AB19FA5|nr:V-set and immunoglobulin domain-containing protein 10 isoform X2 [Pezoporus flaviventris]